MARKNYSVAPHARGWGVKRDGAQRASAVFDSKERAMRFGRDLAQKAGGELRIKGATGRIQDSDSYGRDPSRSRDRVH